MSRVSSRGTHMGFDALDIDVQLNRQKNNYKNGRRGKNPNSKRGGGKPKREGQGLDKKNVLMADEVYEKGKNLKL